MTSSLETIAQTYTERMHGPRADRLPMTVDPTLTQHFRAVAPGVEQVSWGLAAGLDVTIDATILTQADRREAFRRLIHGLALRGVTVRRIGERRAFGRPIFQNRDDWMLMCRQACAA